MVPAKGLGVKEIITVIKANSFCSEETERAINSKIGCLVEVIEVLFEKPRPLFHQNKLWLVLYDTLFPLSVHYSP